MQSFASTLQVQLNLNVSLVGIDKREPNCELMAVSLLFFIVYHYDRRLQRKLECVLRIIFVFMISQVLRTVWSLDSIWVFSKTSFFCLALQKLQFPTPSSVVENSADGQDGPTSCLQVDHATDTNWVSKYFHSYIQFLNCSPYNDWYIPIYAAQQPHFS